MHKTYLIIIGCIVIGAGLLFLLLDNPQNSSKQSAPARQFSVVQDDITNGATLLDVRTSDEYQSGHFAQAKNLDVEDIKRGSRPDVDKNTTIYVYCRSGNRSAQAKQLLEMAGFAKIIDLGGLASVQKVGGEIVK